MEKRTKSILSDISFLIVLILVFTGVVFLAFDAGNLPSNTIVLGIAVAMIMITYFTNLKVGLVLNIIFVFLVLAYTISRSIEQGTAITYNIYFWIIWPTLMLIFIQGFLRNSRMMDEENARLHRQLRNFVTIDEMTQSNNLLAFERDAKVYMNIANRYNMQLCVVLWKLTYPEDLERLFGKENVQKVIVEINDSIKRRMRKEDLIYMVSKEPYVWGALLFTKPEATDIVVKHVKEEIRTTDLRKYTTQKDFSLETTSAVELYDGSPITPLAFLAKAKEQLS